MDYHGSEREDSDPHALRRDPARTYSLKPPSSAIIGLFNSLSMCIFPKKIGGKTKVRDKNKSCNKVDIEMETRTNRIRRRYSVHQNIIRIITVNCKESKYHLFT